MKKLLKYFVLALVLILPFSVNAAEKVEIVNAKLDYKGDYAEDFPEFPTINGLTMNVSGRFTSLYGDAVATYTFGLKNSDSINYTLNCPGEDYSNEIGAYIGSTTGPNSPTNSEFYSCMIKETEAVRYYMSCENNTLKANTTTNCFLNIMAQEDLNLSSLTNGQYEANDEITIPVAEKKETLKDKVTKITSNPKTSSKYLIIGIIAVGAIAGTVVFIKGNKKVKTMVLLGGIMILPITTLAIATISIKINSNIIVEPHDRFTYIDSNGNLSTYIYGEMGADNTGFTWNQFFNSNNMGTFHDEINTYYHHDHHVGGGAAEGELEAPNMRIRADYYYCMLDEGATDETCQMYDENGNPEPSKYWISDANEPIMATKHEYNDYYYMYSEDWDDESIVFIPTEEQQQNP